MAWEIPLRMRIMKWKKSSQVQVNGSQGINSVVNSSPNSVMNLHDVFVLCGGM